MTRLTVTRTILRDQIKDQILQAILDGRYPPGSRIVETRLARELGTSQTPVREALRSLEALGLLEATAFRGARVRRPSAAELLEAFLVRAELESLAARLAIPCLNDKHLDVLSQHLKVMQHAADGGDVLAEATADAAFHGLVVELAANSILRRMWHSLEPVSRTYLTISSPGVDRRQIADDHIPILDALRLRDPILTATALHHHFENAAEAVRSHWVSPRAEQGVDVRLEQLQPVRPGPS